MTITSQFARADRVREVPECPLAGGSEAACATCRYNALNPGVARVGCAVDTPHDAYRRALDALRVVAPDDAAQLQRILEDERRSPRQELGADDVRAVRAIAERWWPLVGNDVAVQRVVQTLLRFTTVASEQGEPVRVLC